MRPTRALAAVIVAACIYALAGCGGYSPAEQSYLDEMQRRGSEVKLSDPAGELAMGRKACQVLADMKPETRKTIAWLMSQSPRPDAPNWDQIKAATTYLCPDAIPGGF